MKITPKTKSRIISKIVSKAVLIVALFLTTTQIRAQSENQKSKEIMQNNSLGTLKQINAGLLDIGYTEAGPSNGSPIILLHGWPHDIHCYNDVVPILVAKGYRVITPYLRGFGTTRFLSKDTFRNGQQAALAQDIIDLMDALKIKKAIIGGFDWGARTAVVIAALWPDRLNGLVAVSGYSVINPEANLKPLPPKAEFAGWFQYYFGTERGKLGYAQNTYEFNKMIWKFASPLWNFDKATYDQTAQSFDNPDHVAIVIHNYRWRLSLEAGESKYNSLEKILASRPSIKVPTITIGSDSDGANADGKSYADKFTGKYEHRILKGIGHDVPQEDPKSFAQAIIDVDGFAKAK